MMLIPPMMVPTTEVQQQQQQQQRPPARYSFGRTTEYPLVLPQERTNIITVGYPGFFSTRPMLSKYTGPDPVIILDKIDGKEQYRTTCQYAPRLIHRLHPLPDVEEIALGWSWNPLDWYSIIKCLCVRWFYRYSCLPLSHSILRRNNLGGYLDQATCTTYVESAVRQIEAEVKEGAKEPRKLVLFGFSRGATAVFQTALKLRPELAQYVSMVVLEAPFDTAEHVIERTMRFSWVYKWLFSKLGTLSSPEAYALPEKTNLRRGTPFVFVTSTRDKIVPNPCTQRCIEMLRRHYNNNSDDSQQQYLPIEHLELHHSRHPMMPLNSREDINRYIDFMEKTYNKYVPLVQ